MVDSKKLLIEEYLIAALLLVMTVINGANIVARYALQYSLAFSEELVVYLFVWTTLLGASAAMARGANLGLSIFTDLLPPRWRRHAAALSTLCGIVLFSVLLFMGYQMVLSEFRMQLTTPSMGIPEWIFGLAIPVGAGFFIYRCVQLLIQTYKKTYKEAEK